MWFYVASSDVFKEWHETWERPHQFCLPFLPAAICWYHLYAVLKLSYVLLSSQTLFAEGCRGSCSEELIGKFNLREGKDQQSYGLGKFLYNYCYWCYCWYCRCSCGGPLVVQWCVCIVCNSSRKRCTPIPLLLRFLPLWDSSSFAQFFSKLEYFHLVLFTPYL